MRGVAGRNICISAASARNSALHWASVPVRLRGDETPALGTMLPYQGQPSRTACIMTAVESTSMVSGETTGQLCSVIKGRWR